MDAAALRFAAGRFHVVLCLQNGISASTVSPDQFRSLAAGLPASLTLTEVDGSSLFCILRKPEPAG